MEKNFCIHGIKHAHILGGGAWTIRAILTQSELVPKIHTREQGFLKPQYQELIFPPPIRIFEVWNIKYFLFSLLMSGGGGKKRYIETYRGNLAQIIFSTGIFECVP